MAALTGSAITSVVQLLFSLRAILQAGKIPTLKDIDWVLVVLAAITGGIIGWGYRLAIGLRTTTDEALTRLEATTQTLKFQEEPLKMLASTRRHAETVGLLLSDSMKEKYKFISYVDENKYLSYLVSAISDSRKYEGIQRFPVRWFARDDHETAARYLQVLRDQNMKEKTRVFIIDKPDEKDMKEDLLNKELMKFYWDNTGRDVKTYWITVPELGGLRSIPRDFALYDDELLIEYDGSTQTLVFDIIQPSASRREIFIRLADQEKSNAGYPFQRIDPK